MEQFTSILKKLLNKMGLNVKGKLLTGNEAKEKLAKELLGYFEDFLK